MFSSEFNSLATISCAINNCTLCRLHETRNLAVPGEGPSNAELMFVGEAPGHVNDQLGRPFVGQGGRIFDGILETIGINRESIFVTNAVKCWPPENQRPKPDELRVCQKYLDAQICIVKPKLIFAFGATAFTQLTGQKIRMKEDHGAIVMVRAIPVCAVFHPNGIRYIKGGRQTIIKCIEDALRQLGLSDLIIPPCTGDNTGQQGDLFE